MKKEEQNKTSRQLIIEVLERLHPHCDLNDDETLFGIICDDYEQYAEMINSREADISRAHAEGEVAGRNAAIDQMLDSSPVGDGVPALGGANNNASAPGYSIFNIASGMGVS